MNKARFILLPFTIINGDALKNLILTLKISLIKNQTIHTGEIPYQCEICEKSVNEKSILIQRHRVHSGAKNFVIFN